ncbi:hypothetical protein N0V90_006106 [Kalmusia sp. IMI 367209]|nr:hypothetical protein N0V90_006106 [Kalmusia sp. IMI 367209]
MSENEVYLGSRQSAFLPATSNGPSDVTGDLDEASKNYIRDFVASRSRDIVAQNPHVSTDQVYSPLSRGEIRVLELYPGISEDPLCGSLHVVSVDFEYPRVNNYKRLTNHAISLSNDNSFWYTALSYTWGPPDFNIEFHLANGSSIRITSSLASALRHLRSQNDGVFLWIDQICINQKSTKEKEEQIPLMGMIYNHATNTVIWLGDEGGDDPLLALDTLQTVHSRLQLSDGEISPDEFERLNFPAPDAPDWAEVSKLFCRVWFTRTWVIQEAILSTNLYIKCGDAVVPWDDFALWCGTMEASGLRSWVERGSPVSETQSGLHTVFELSTFRIFTQTHEAKPVLLESLVLTRYADASVAKDKVYGVLGVAASDIVPRYSNEVSVRDVFLEAALSALPSDLFPLLSCVDHDRPLLPSWVPDWTLPRVTESLGYSTKSWALYSASGRRANIKNDDAYEAAYKLDDGNRSLILPGRVVDSIESLGEPLNEEAFLLMNDNRVFGNRTWLTYVTMIKDMETYPTGETVWDAFWETIVAGKDGSSNASAPQDYSEVLSLIVDESFGQELHIVGQPYSPRRQKGFFTLKSLTSRKPKITLEDLKKALKAALRWRRFAITKKGYFCLVPRGTRVNDMVVVFKAGHVPFVVRNQEPAEVKGNYELLGETYVHGIMKGEAFSEGSGDLQSIRVV